MRASVLLVTLGLAACGPTSMQGGGPADAATADGPRADLAPPPADMAYTGQFYRFVTDRITFPQMATDFAFAPNGDGFPHNQFAKLVLALFQRNLPLQPAETVAVTIDGDGLALLSLGTRDPNLIGDTAPFVNVYIADPKRAPDFGGMGMFAIHPNYPKGTLGGVLQAGVFVGADPSRLPAAPTAPLRISLGSTSRVTLPLVGAHITFNASPTGLTKGELHGALRGEDVDKVLIPALAANLTLIAQQPNCAQLADCQNVRMLFDTAPKDGKVDAAEVKTSAYLEQALKPDLDLYDAAGKWAPNPRNTDPESWSFGVGFTAKRAIFVEK